MFTGIITDTTVLSSQTNADGLLITFQKPAAWDDLQEGESISTEGVCLTVTHVSDTEYSCHLMAETLMKTTYGSTVPTQVNLERSLKVGDRFGGHIVQGHIDDTGTVVKITNSLDRKLYIKFSSRHKLLVVEQGAININGVSLTIAELKGNILGVALIPYTMTHTTLGTLVVNDKVNLEFDMIGKHIVRIMNSYANK